MDKEILDAIGAAVRGELDGLKNDVLTKVNESRAELLTALRAEALNDTKPTAEKVIELEKQLKGWEEKLAEEIRKLQIAGVLAENGIGTGKGKGYNGPEFKGQFIKDVEQLKEILRSLPLSSQTSTRAIDTGLFATGGKLAAELADQFMDFMIEQQTTLSRIQTRRMNGPDGNTDELRVAARKIRKATEATAPTVANAVTTKRRTITNVEVIWAEDITLTFMEDNIERRGIEAHIAKALAQGFGNDNNDLAWNGDSAQSAGTFEGCNDGFSKLAGADGEVNTVILSQTVYGTVDTVQKVLKFMLRAMPINFQGRVDNAFFVPMRTAMIYAEEVSQRLTGLGDQVLINGFPSLRYFGLPVIAEPHMTGTTGQSTGSKAVLTPLGNLFFAMQRAIMIDAMWQPRKRVVEYTLSARTDYQYATGQALVLASAIPVALR